MKDKKIKLLLYCCLQEELIKKFKVGRIMTKKWFYSRFLGSTHHIRKNLRPPILKEMLLLGALKTNKQYGNDALEICKPLIDLDDTGKIYRSLNFF